MITTLEEIKVWHYFVDGRFFKKYKLEVSDDNMNWITIYDSDVDGVYIETIGGKSHTNLAI